MGDEAQMIDAALADFAKRPNVQSTDEQLNAAMRLCVEHGFDQLPMPGSGHTLQRWRKLATVGGIDLALLKGYEGHTDALAILAELKSEPFSEPGVWGVWAAEPPSARVHVSPRGNSPSAEVLLNGHKAWCSGAQSIDYALITAWDEQQQAQLVAVSLHQPGVSIEVQAWQAIGMGSSASVDVYFDNATGFCIGQSGDYLSRPGFWQGGAGIAAAWYGAAVALARALHQQRCHGRPDAHADAHLGAVDAALLGARAALRECAAWIDAHPQEDARLPVQRVRAQVEMAVEQVCRHVGRALGATPFCRDAQFARLAADLPVFIRQSHAERDLAQLGEMLAARSAEEWSL